VVSRGARRAGGLTCATRPAFIASKHQEQRFVTIAPLRRDDILDPFPREERISAHNRPARRRVIFADARSGVPQ
jgi:hypothetical protein